METWREAGPVLERLRREELRRIDVQAAIAALCVPADYSQPPYAPAPTSGLIEQQRWFALAKRRG